MPHRLLSIVAAFLLAACAGTAPDPYAGFYEGDGKVVRIVPAGSFAYQVRILPKSGPAVTLQATVNEGKLTSEWGGGFSVTQESAAGYSMGVPEKVESIRKIDSAGFAQWVTSTRPDLAPSDSGDAALEEDAPGSDTPKTKSRFR